MGRRWQQYEENADDAMTVTMKWRPWLWCDDDNNLGFDGDGEGEEGGGGDAQWRMAVIPENQMSFDEDSGNTVRICLLELRDRVNK